MKRILPSKKIIKARVIKGAGRGKKIKVPTVNFDPSSAYGLKEGIYVCRVIIGEPYWGVLHFGPRPAFGEEDRSLEVHLFDFIDGTETRTADIEIYDFIRKVANFKDKNALIAKINEDIAYARRKILSLKS